MAKNDEKYAYLNRLSTEQLEELLRMDMEMAEPGNEDVVFHILEVIEQREDEHPTGRIPDVDKAWRSFRSITMSRRELMTLYTPVKPRLATVPRIQPSFLLLARPACTAGLNRALSR